MTEMADDVHIDFFSKEIPSLNIRIHFYFNSSGKLSRTPNEFTVVLRYRFSYAYSSRKNFFYLNLKHVSES